MTPRHAAALVVAVLAALAVPGTAFALPPEQSGFGGGPAVHGAAPASCAPGGTVGGLHQAPASWVATVCGGRTGL
ncbi:hypothetical protein F4553_000922 [Allocatelliglobosispora scoriae]|uniref:Uncharacterized protein n=1 Tax=Allocatelliglobosispora scoriae TaxID=643052 RepID=A0A841BKL7_9ACTN|nr:hypothetical protein [Allocatelliglobosispora scoriae]MBB5867543.1 hypothetical protein [Allocatelliglobosispora scoriae]